MVERTLVLLKPDAVERSLAGEIISRFEKVGLSIEKMKMLRASRALLRRHYPNTKDWFESVGERTIEDCQKRGVDPFEIFGTKDLVEIGKIVKGWTVDYVSSAPVVAMIVSGEDAIGRVRKIVGPTIPANAPKGTIRGDFSKESAVDANREKRAIRNLVHASGDPSEAQREIGLWAKFL